MMNFTLKLENLLPLLANMPPLFKKTTLFLLIINIMFVIILIIFNIIRLIRLGFFYYKKNNKFKLVKVSTKLNRLFEDYDDEIEDIKYGFNKERSTVEANLIHHYKGYDGTHVPRIYKNSLNDFLEKLDKRLKKLIQDVENILLECYETKDINLISKLEKEKLKFEYMIKKTNQTKQYFNSKLRDLIENN